jgi:hypothetical protein
MKVSKISIVMVVVALVAVGLVIFLMMGKKPVSKTTVEVVPTTVPTAIPSLAPTAVPTVATGYSAALRAKVRAEFVSECSTRGRQTAAVCTCTADYLAKNYTEAQLADFYVQFHTSGQLPEAVKAAAGKCGGK